MQKPVRGEDAGTTTLETQEEREKEWTEAEAFVVRESRLDGRRYGQRGKGVLKRESDEKVVLLVLSFEGRQSPFFLCLQSWIYLRLRMSQIRYSSITT